MNFIRQRKFQISRILNEIQKEEQKAALNSFLLAETHTTGLLSEEGYALRASTMRPLLASKRQCSELSLLTLMSRSA